MILYFLLPRSRRPFFDPKIRGWENEPRFKFNLSCRCNVGWAKNTMIGELVDVSSTGSCICFNEEMTLGDNIEIEFSFHNLNFTLQGKIVRAHTQLGPFCYGIKFSIIQYGDRKNLKKLISALHVLHSK